MKTLDSSVNYLVETLESSLGPELKAIEEKDWSSMEGDKMRKTQKIHKILTERNISHGEKLFKDAAESGDLHNPRVKSILESIVKLVHIYSLRYESFYSRNDWNKYLEDDGLDPGIDVEAELSYQSQLLDTMIEFKQKISKFDLSSTKEKIAIPTHGKTTVPFIMREAVYARYPEVKEFMDRKMSND